MLRCAFFAATTAVVFGQSQPNVSSADDLAKKTLSAFEAVFKSDRNAFESMVASTLVLKAATLAQLYDANKRNTHAAVVVIPEWTWTMLRERVKAAQAEFLNAYRTAHLILSGSDSTATTAAAAIQQAQKRLEDLTSEKTAKEQVLGDHARRA
jgi:hypothetical protein